MRPTIRSLVIAAGLALLAVPAVSGAVLAAPGNGASDQFVVDDTWCFPAVDPDHCFRMEGRFTSANSTGADLVTGVLRQYTAAYEDGVLVSETFEHSVSQWRTAHDGDSAVLEIEHSRYVSEDQSCVASAVLRIGDYSIVVDHWRWSCH